MFKRKECINTKHINIKFIKLAFIIYNSPKLKSFHDKKTKTKTNFLDFFSLVNSEQKSIENQIQNINFQFIYS